MRVHGQFVAGRLGGAPLLAVGVLVVGAGVVPPPADDEGESAWPLLPALLLLGDHSHMTSANI